LCPSSNGTLQASPRARKSQARRVFGRGMAAGCNAQARRLGAPGLQRPMLLLVGHPRDNYRPSRSTCCAPRRGADRTVEFAATRSRVSTTPHAPRSRRTPITRPDRQRSASQTERAPPPSDDDRERQRQQGRAATGGGGFVAGNFWVHMAPSHSHVRLVASPVTPPNMITLFPSAAMVPPVCRPSSGTSCQVAETARARIGARARAKATAASWRESFSRLIICLPEVYPRRDGCAAARASRPSISSTTPSTAPAIGSR
jgi:hypothetical protein